MNARIKNLPTLLENPLCLLFKALLYKQLGRDGEIAGVLKDFQNLPRIEPGVFLGGKTAMSMQVTLLEALELPEEAEKLASAAIETARSKLSEQPLGKDILALVLLYRDRARSRILQGDMAGALADERTALELPPLVDLSVVVTSAEEAQQIHLNTIIREWEMLEQEFPAYADYLEANGWPEPKPDRRNLRAVD